MNWYTASLFIVLVLGLAVIADCTQESNTPAHHTYSWDAGDGADTHGDAMANLQLDASSVDTSWTIHGPPAALMDRHCTLRMPPGMDECHGGYVCDWLDESQDTLICER